MRVIARAIVRSGIEPVYSEGFNPHLKLSLPLPRNVGLSSEDELFCVKIKASENISQDSLAKQLPERFELVSFDVTERGISYQPVEVEYFIKVNLPDKREQIQRINEQIQAGEEILMERTVNEEGDIKIVDVAKYLKPFEIADNGVRVICRILPSGTIRPDEILRLLDIDSSEISSSIIRKKVSWQIN